MIHNILVGYDASEVEPNPRSGVGDSTLVQCRAQIQDTICNQY